jgi:hypothetical protein
MGEKPAEERRPLKHSTLSEREAAEPKAGVPAYTGSKPFIRMPA